MSTYGIVFESSGYGLSDSGLKNYTVTVIFG